MKLANLPKELKFNTCADLVRVGGLNDGGYLVSKADINKTTLILGFGINTDWEFEKNFISINPIEVRAFDASTSFTKFFEQSLRNIYRLKFWKAIIIPFKYLSFKKFFSGKNKFYKKFVGFSDGAINISLNDVLGKLDHEDIFIKMDIEGSEYRCLQDLILNQSLISGAVIEFHEVDLHLDKILKFINNFSLHIAHIHVNNFASITPKGIPLVIEITFSKYGKFLEQNPTLPHKLDKVNNIECEEIQIIF